MVADTRRLDDCFGAVDFLETRRIPFIVAVNCFEGADIYDEDEVRQALDIDARVPVQHFDARNRGSSKQVLLRLLEYLMASAMAARSGLLAGFPGQLCDGRGIWGWRRVLRMSSR